MITKAKRGQVSIGQLPGVAIALLVAAVTIAIAVFVVGEFGSQMTGTAAQVTGNVTDLFSNMVSLLPTYGTILGAALIIGVIAVLGVRFMNR